MEKHVKTVRYYLPTEIDNQKSFTVEYNNDFSVKSFDNIDNITYDNGRLISYTKESSNNQTENISLELDGDKLMKKVEVAGEETEDFILYFDGNKGQPYGKLKIFDSFSLVEIYEWTNHNITKISNYEVPSLNGQTEKIPDNLYTFIGNSNPYFTTTIQYDNHPKTFKFFEGVYEYQSYFTELSPIESFQTMNNPTLITRKIYSFDLPNFDISNMEINTHFKYTYDKDGYISRQETFLRQTWESEGRDNLYEHDGVILEFDYVED
ncbi:hypothetical protein AVL50_15460 [Flammeovirga sp. SJP92]|nr:hypothetical protein AVL50_15460 [Flammeovirga sp. SJP92]